VLRCLELRYDDANERYYARAEITDPEGGADAAVDVYRVAVRTLEKLQTGEEHDFWERLESPPAPARRANPWSS
jgi:hypothetical protein